MAYYLDKTISQVDAKAVYASEDEKVKAYISKINALILKGQKDKAQKYCTSLLKKENHEEIIAIAENLDELAEYITTELNNARERYELSEE